MDLGVINASTLVTDNQVWQMVKAINDQLIDFCSDWHLDRTVCWWCNKGDKIGPGIIPIYIIDSPDVANALGYHDEENGRIAGKVFAKPVLDAGGGILDGGKIGDSVSAVVSHECLEAKADPNTNLWVDGPITVAGSVYASVAREVADPCQGGSYSINGVLVSDYVLPAWFDGGNRIGPFNKLRTIKAPFTVDQGGYAIVRDQPGSEQSVFGELDARPWRVRTRSKMRRKEQMVLGASER